MGQSVGGWDRPPVVLADATSSQPTHFSQSLPPPLLTSSSRKKAAGSSSSRSSSRLILPLKSVKAARDVWRRVVKHGQMVPRQREVRLRSFTRRRNTMAKDSNSRVVLEGLELVEPPLRLLPAALEAAAPAVGQGERRQGRERRRCAWVGGLSIRSRNDSHTHNLCDQKAFLSSSRLTRGALGQEAERGERAHGAGPAAEEVHRFLPLARRAPGGMDENRIGRERFASGSFSL